MIKVSNAKLYCFLFLIYVIFCVPYVWSNTKKTAEQIKSNIEIACKIPSLEIIQNHLGTNNFELIGSKITYFANNNPVKRNDYYITGRYLNKKDTKKATTFLLILHCNNELFSKVQLENFKIDKIDSMKIVKDQSTQKVIINFIEESGEFAFINWNQQKNRYLLEINQHDEGL